MSVINPGELNESLTVLYKINEGALDDKGFPVDTIQHLYKLRCKRKTTSTKEFIGSDKQTTELTYKFIVRKRNIDNNMLILYKGKTFDIKHVHEIDTYFLEITASESGGVSYGFGI